MGPKWKRTLVQITVGAVGALALSASAQAAFITYAASATNATSIAATSDAIDLGGLVDSFIANASLGLTVSAASAATVMTGQEGLQVVQGCALAATLCTASDWIDLTGKGLSLGGASFTQSITPTEVKLFTTGSMLVSGVSVESLRLRWDASTISPPASVGATGSLTVTAVPESGTWALMLAGLIAAGGIARARRRFLA